MTPELIIFDCDGVLVDSERLVNRIEAEWLRDLGIVVTPTACRALLKGKTVAEIATLLETRLSRPLPPEWLYNRGMATANSLVQDLQACPGVTTVLETVTRRGIAKCVASQSPLPRVQPSLRVTGLAQYFGERVFTASMVARGKPAPELFLSAAERCGVAPEQCIGVCDVVWCSVIKVLPGKRSLSVTIHFPKEFDDFSH